MSKNSDRSRWQITLFAGLHLLCCGIPLLLLSGGLARLPHPGLAGHGSHHRCYRCGRLHLVSQTRLRDLSSQ